MGSRYPSSPGRALRCRRCVHRRQTYLTRSCPQPLSTGPRTIPWRSAPTDDRPGATKTRSLDGKRSRQRHFQTPAIIRSVVNNGEGGAGAPSAVLMPVKVLDDNGLAPTAPRERDHVCGRSRRPRDQPQPGRAGRARSSVGRHRLRHCARRRRRGGGGKRRLGRTHLPCGRCRRRRRERDRRTRCASELLELRCLDRLCSARRRHRHHLTRRRLCELRSARHQRRSDGHLRPALRGRSDAQSRRRDCARVWRHRRLGRRRKSRTTLSSRQVLGLR